MESDVFGPLTTYGIARNDLVLAFDFTVQSENQLTRQIVSMRDQAYSLAQHGRYDRPVW